MTSFDSFTRNFRTSPNVARATDQLLNELKTADKAGPLAVGGPSSVSDYFEHPAAFVVGTFTLSAYREENTDSILMVAVNVSLMTSLFFRMGAAKLGTAKLVAIHPVRQYITIYNQHRVEPGSNETRDMAGQ